MADRAVAASDQGAVALADYRAEQLATADSRYDDSCRPWRSQTWSKCGCSDDVGEFVDVQELKPYESR